MGGREEPPRRPLADNAVEAAAESGPGSLLVGDGTFGPPALLLRKGPPGRGLSRWGNTLGQMPRPRAGRLSEPMSVVPAALVSGGRGVRRPQRRRVRRRHQRPSQRG